MINELFSKQRGSRLLRLYGQEHILLLQLYGYLRSWVQHIRARVQCVIKISLYLSALCISIVWVFCRIWISHKHPWTTINIIFVRWVKCNKFVYGGFSFLYTLIYIIFNRNNDLINVFLLIQYHKMSHKYVGGFAHNEI